MSFLHFCGELDNITKKKPGIFTGFFVDFMQVKIR